MNKRLAFIWNSYCKQMDKYQQNQKKKLTREWHKARADKWLDEYFTELEREIITEN